MREQQRDLPDVAIAKLLETTTNDPSDDNEPWYVVQWIGNFFTVQGNIERVYYRARTRTLRDARKLARAFKAHGSPSSVRIIVQ